MDQVIHEVSAWLIGAAAVVAIGCFAAGYHFGRIESLDQDNGEGGSDG